MFSDTKNGEKGTLSYSQQVLTLTDTKAGLLDNDDDMIVDLEIKRNDNDMMKKQSWTKENPNGDYFLLDNEKDNRHLSAASETVLTGKF